MELYSSSNKDYSHEELTYNSRRLLSDDLGVTEAALCSFRHFLSNMSFGCGPVAASSEDCGNGVMQRRQSVRLRSTEALHKGPNVCTSSSAVETPLSTPPLGCAKVVREDSFSRWPKPRLRMSPSTARMQKRRSSPARLSVPDEKEARRPEQVRVRTDAERRSKFQEDRPLQTSSKSKMKAVERNSQPKKRKAVNIPESDSDEGADDDHEWSGEDAMAAEEDDADSTDDSGDESIPQHRPSRDRIMKKLVTLDVNGLPWGNMKECLSDDIKKYAKSLDPTANWESQPTELRSQLFRRLYMEWNMIGHSYKLSEKWVGPKVTKVLITTRWRLNTLIDAGQPKPADVTQEQWNILVRRRSTEDSQILSEHMRSISQGKGSRTAQLKAIERDAIVKLTLEHSRKPYQTEITDEVAREYTRQQLEKRKATLRKGADMDDVYTRVVDIEGSVCRLEQKIGDSHKRMEEMLKALITSQSASEHSLPDFGNHMPRSEDVPNTEGMEADRNTMPGFSNAVFVDLVAVERHGPREEVEAVGEPVPQEVPESDIQVENFLKDLLQEPNSVVGSPEPIKSTDTVVLSGGTDSLRNKVNPHDIPALGMPSALGPNSAKVGIIGEIAREIPQTNEEDAAVESTLQVRRNAGKGQSPKNCQPQARRGFTEQASLRQLAT